MYPAHERIWQSDYAAYAEALADFVGSRVAAPTAEDVLQDVWEAYARALETTTVDQPRAWLYRVARHRIADHYRLASRLADRTGLPYEELLASDPDWFDEDGEWDGEALRLALARLPDAQRDVFERNVLGGETLREIAEAEGLSIKTVISRKGYARKRLRQLLGDNFYDRE